MIYVAIIGLGNVSFHLYKALYEVKEINVKQLNSREKFNVDAFDIVIIAVSDNAIEQVSKKILNKKILVTHTSGNSSIKTLKNKGRKGVFYPLQSFTKEKKIEFKTIPICIESEKKDDFKLLEKLALTISNKVYNINFNQRKALHIAAVYVNNFVNHMYKIGNDICEENNIPFEILYPLINETAKKITHISPEKAQTGPAIRNDNKTIESHLNFTKNIEKEIYLLITKSIQKNG